jgi:hypothetical protein
MNYYVYMYIDPRDNLPFYVGKGKDNRLKKHLSETFENTENRRKYAYIQGLRNKGIEPIIKKIKENLSQEDAYEFEEDLIRHYGRKDLDTNGILTNICIDNRPPVITGEKHHQFGKAIITYHTEETKKKISDAHKGRPSMKKGTTCSEETKERMSNAQKGRIISEEAKEKLREYKQEKNSQFGSIWITDGTTNKKIKKDIDIPTGWYKGRTFKEGYKRVRN